MPYDGFTQVAPDSTGKKIDMDVVSTTAGTTLYREKAILVGETGDTLQALLTEQVEQTRILMAILQVLISSSPEFAGVDPLDKDKWPSNG